MIQRIPINVLKPRMLFDCLRAALDVTKSLGDVDCTEASNERAGVLGHSGRVSNATFHDLFVDLHWVLVPKWGLADKELVYEDTKSPPVDGAAVASVADDFRCEVFRCATECICFP